MFETEHNQSKETGERKSKFGSSSSGLNVVLRVRDNSDREPCLHGVGLRSLALVPPEDSNAFKAGESGSQYTFSRVFGSSTTQQQLFHEVCAPLCGRVVAALAVENNGGAAVGRTGSANGVIMCYGITAAGKTYTIEGNEEEPGMLPCTVAYLLHKMPHGCCLQLSHYEVYNDQVYDLLAQPDDHATATVDLDMKQRERRVPLRVMEDAYGRVNVTNALWMQLDNDETSAMRAVRRTLRRRATGSTKLNANSSRSHSVVILRATAAHDASVFHDITFVDLAGSERASRTNNDGIRLKESACINSSLMALGRCLEALRHNSEYHSTTRVVPFRESKITHIFRDVLHGRGKLILMVNVSTAAGDYDETTHVLRYAALAAGVATTRSKNAASDNDRANPRKRMRMTALPRVATLARKPGADSHGSALGKVTGVPSGAGGSHVRGQSTHIASTARHMGVVAEFEEYVSDEDDDDDDIVNDDEDIDNEGEAAEHVQACIQLLTSRLHEAEKRAASLEAEVREEVAGEVAQMLRDMEQQHARQLETTRAQIGPSRVRELEEALLLMQETNNELERQLRLEREQRAASSGATEELEQRMRRELDEEKVQVVANMSLELETAESLLATVTSKNTTLMRENEEMKDTILQLLKVVEGDADHDGAGQILRVDRAGLASTFPWLKRKLSLRSSNDGNKALQLEQDQVTDQHEEEKKEQANEEEEEEEEESDRRSTREKYSTSPMAMPESASKPVRVMASEYDTIVIGLQKKEDEEDQQRGRKTRTRGGSTAKALKGVDADMAEEDAGKRKGESVRRSRRISSAPQEQIPAAGKHETITAQPPLAAVTEREDDCEQECAESEREHDQHRDATSTATDDTAPHIVDDDENLAPVVGQDANLSEKPTATGTEKTRVPKPRTMKTKKLLATKSDDADFNSQIAEALGEAEPVAIVAPTPIARRTRQRKPMAMR